MIALSALALGYATLLTQHSSELTLERMQQVFDDHDFNGVIYEHWAGEEAQAVAQGLADPIPQRSLTSDTRFQTGSIDKYFAAIAVFALIDEGVLSLDEPIAHYLPDYRPDTGAQITLRTLLSNTSGLPNDLRLAFRRLANGEQDAVDAQTVSEAVADYASGDLAFEPGTQFDYALSNWLLVQHILAQVTGLSYPEVRQRYVYDRAGMEQSGGYVHDLTETTPVVTNVAIGFDRDDPDGRGDYWSPNFFKGSYTTGQDMIALERALEAGEVLSEAGLEAFRSIFVEDQNYAYGGRYRTLDLCGETYFASTQAGSNGATNITSTFVPSLDAGVVMLTNVDESQGQMFGWSYALLETRLGCAP